MKKMTMVSSHVHKDDDQKKKKDWISKDKDDEQIMLTHIYVWSLTNTNHARGKTLI
jgi:hypothetical protein